MRTFRLFPLVVAVILMLSRCDMSSIPEAEQPADDPSDSGPLTESMVRLNLEMQRLMQQYYLWNSSIAPDLTTAESAATYDSQELFYRMLAPQDTWSGMRTYAQFVQTTNAVLTIYGFGAVFCTTYTQGKWQVLVQCVHPGSPLWKQHVRRGDILTRINNGSAVQQYFNGTLAAALARPSATFTFSRSSASEIHTMKVYRAIYTMTPLLHQQVCTAGDGRTAGYMMYHQFENYPDAAERLDACFRTFREAGATSLVIDLRYNEGTSLEQAGLLASWLLPDTCTGEVPFIRQIGNGSAAAAAAFPDIRITRRPDAPGFRKIAVITSEQTARAAEIFIHCLKAYYPDLLVIGHQTAGDTFVRATRFFPEPVPDTSVTPEWVYMPVVARTADKDGRIVSPDGIPADVECEDDLLHDFGVNSLLSGEACLETALHHVMSQEP